MNRKGRKGREAYRVGGERRKNHGVYGELEGGAECEMDGGWNHG